MFNIGSLVEDKLMHIAFVLRIKKFIVNTENNGIKFHALLVSRTNNSATRLLKVPVSWYQGHLNIVYLVGQKTILQLSREVFALPPLLDFLTHQETWVSSTLKLLHFMERQQNTD